MLDLLSIINGNRASHNQELNSDSQHEYFRLNVRKANVLRILFAQMQGFASVQWKVLALSTALGAQCECKEKTLWVEQWEICYCWDSLAVAANTLVNGTFRIVAIERCTISQLLQWLLMSPILTFIHQERCIDNASLAFSSIETLLQPAT